MGWIDFSLPAAATQPADEPVVSLADETSLAVVGLDYANDDKTKSNRRFEMMMCVPGEPVELHLEPKNKHDERAIAVYSARGIQLGYLTAERCGWIGSRIKAGEECDAIFQEAGTWAAVIRLRFNGGPPTLPAPRPQAEPSRLDDRDFSSDYEFQPDPDGPEWGA